VNNGALRGHPLAVGHVLDLNDRECRLEGVLIVHHTAWLHKLKAVLQVQQPNPVHRANATVTEHTADHRPPAGNDGEVDGELHLRLFGHVGFEDLTHLDTELSNIVLGENARSAEGAFSITTTALAERFFLILDLPHTSVELADALVAACCDLVDGGTPELRLVQEVHRQWKCIAASFFGCTVSACHLDLVGVWSVTQVHRLADLSRQVERALQQVCVIALQGDTAACHGGQNPWNKGRSPAIPSLNAWESQQCMQPLGSRPDSIRSNSVSAERLAMVGVRQQRHPFCKGGDLV